MDLMNLKVNNSQVNLPLYYGEIYNNTYVNDNIIEALEGSTAKINAFNIFLGDNFVTYQSIPKQTVNIFAYGCVYIIFDINTKRFSETLVSLNTTSGHAFDKSKLYIPLFTTMYGRISWTKWNKLFMDFPSEAMLMANALSSLSGRYFGRLYQMVMRVKGFLINLRAIGNPVTSYLLDMDTEILTLIEEFPTTDRSLGVNNFNFSNVQMIGGRKQLIICGAMGYKWVSGDDVLWDQILIEYDITNQRILSINHPSFFFPIRLLLDDVASDSSMKHQPVPLDNAICAAGNSNSEFMNETKLSYDLSLYLNESTYSYAIGPYIPYNCEVTKISVNVRNISTDVEIYKIDMRLGTYELIKTVTPEAVGVLNITLDSPIEINPTQQLGLVGHLGYKYNVNAGLPLYNFFYWDFSSRTVKYKISMSLSPNIVEFGIKYTFKRPIEIKRALKYFNINVMGELFDFQNEVKHLISLSSYETVTVSIADYNNNLQNVYAAINPSESKHYTILIPEGTYNVNEWFTQSQIESSNETHWRGVELVNYTKLLGVGRTDKIVLQWLNPTSATHWGYISVLNTNHWHELENLTIKANNIRYCVHDDIWDGHDRYLRVKNCVFESYDYVSRAWGAGCNGGYDAVFENCKFIMNYYAPYNTDARDNYIEPMCLHDNQYNVGRDSHLVLKNCRFYVPYTDIKLSMEPNRNSWQEISYSSSYPMYDDTKTDYAINDCVNMPNNTQYSYKCLYANSHIPPYMIGRPSINIGFGWENTDGVLYVTIEGCSANTYIAVPSKQTRVTGFGNIFGKDPILWDEGDYGKDEIYDLI